MGYGARALQCLNSFYSGEYFNLDESTAPEQLYPDPTIVEEVCLNDSLVCMRTELIVHEGCYPVD